MKIMFADFCICLLLLFGCVKGDNYWEGNAKFGFDLLAELSKETDANVFISPFSISSAFSLAYAGAPNQTETHDQILDVLYYPPNMNEVDLAKHVINQQKDLTDNTKQNVDVAIANRIFYDHNSKLNDQITGVIGDDNYEPVNFCKSEDTVNMINKWIQDNTDGEIKDLVKKAIVLKAKWEYEFDKEQTKSNQKFYHDATRDVEINSDVSYMHMEKNIFDLKYFSTDDFEFLKIPFSHDKNAYQANKYYMLIALPKSTSIAASTSPKTDGDLKLTYQDFNQAVNILGHNNTDAYDDYIQDRFKKPLGGGLRNIKIELSLPKMRIDSGDLHLVENFKNLGMIAPLTEGLADFTNLRDPKHNQDEGIFIKDIIHQTVFEMKEEGVKAVAATVIEFSYESSFEPPPVFYQPFKVDHPFYVAIMAENIDTNDQKLLFVGHINQIN